MVTKFDLLVKNYLDRSTLHGLKYISDSKRHWIEK